MILIFRHDVSSSSSVEIIDFVKSQSNLTRVLEEASSMYRSVLVSHFPFEHSTHEQIRRIVERYCSGRNSKVYRQEKLFAVNVSLVIRYSIPSNTIKSL